MSENGKLVTYSYGDTMPLPNNGVALIPKQNGAKPLAPLESYVLWAFASLVAMDVKPSIRNVLYYMKYELGYDIETSSVQAIHRKFKKLCDLELLDCEQTSPRKKTYSLGAVQWRQGSSSSKN